MPTQERIKELRAQRLAIHKRMGEIQAPATTEGRSMTAEEASSWDAAYADFQARGDDLEHVERQAAADSQMSEIVGSPVAGAVGGTRESDKSEAEARYAKVFDKYCRTGVERLSADERDVLQGGFSEYRDMSVGTNSAGGYAVPTGFWAKLTTRQKMFGGVRKVANILETSTGETINWPTNDDTANPAVIIGENTGASESDLVLGQNHIGAWAYTTGAIKVPYTLLADAGIDLDTVIPERFAKRFGRGQNRDFTGGNGTSAPQGIKAFTAASGVSTLDYTGLIGTVFGLDAAYRESGEATWQISDSALKACMLLEDGNGRPLFIPAGSFGSLAEARPSTLLGYEYTVNNDLDAPGAGNVPAVFGDFHSGYVIRDVIGSAVLLRLTERYADAFQVGFIGYQRSDGRIDDAFACVRLQM